ncbi:hypothetical protein CKO09_08725 [Chromatium weissei]|nr:hypothetical protein [Chromatium weissei]
MATFSAYLLAGHDHSNDDGIIPIAELALSKNSRPAWILHPRHGAFFNTPIRLFQCSAFGFLAILKASSKMVCTSSWWRIQNQWKATPRIGGSLAIKHSQF